MGKRKVIDDSDDEDGTDTTPPRQCPHGNPQHSTCTELEDEMTVVPDHLDPSAGPSTASTERLNREIGNARRALVELTPDEITTTTEFPTSSRQQSPNTPSMPRSKLRRTTTTVEKPRAKKPLKTYGSQGRDTFELRVASDGELHSTPPKWPRFEKSKPKHSQNSYSRTGALSSSYTEVLELGLDSTDNNALSRSPIPPSAPELTSTERPLGLDGTAVLKTVSVQSPSECDPLYSEEKIPIGATPSQDLIVKLDSRDEGANHLRTRSRDEMEASNGQHTGRTEPRSMVSAFSADKTTTVAREYLSFSHLCEDSVIEDPTMPLHSNTHTVTEIHDCKGPLPNPVQNDELLDELSLSVPMASVTSKCQIKHQKNTEFSSQLGNRLDSDDITIGLPKDDYQPRPSKSRSGHGNGELLIPADYSKRPEALSMKKRKFSRRKTTAFHELIPKEELEEEEEEAVNKASSEAPNSKIPKSVTQQEELNLENTDKPKGNQEPDERELEPIGKTTGSTKLRGRPKKLAMTESLEHETTEFEERVSSARPTTKVSMPEKEAGPHMTKQANESKKQRGRPKKGAAETSKAKSSEANDASIEHDVEPEYSNHPTTIKKKGRGTGDPVAISEELIQDSDEDFNAADEGGNVPARVLEEIQGNVIPSKPAEKAASSPSPSKSKSVPPETPNKQGSISKGPDKHSPISSGKVSYRVGLSKRQRIAPLLRIVRKS